MFLEGSSDDLSSLLDSDSDSDSDLGSFALVIDFFLPLRAPVVFVVVGGFTGFFACGGLPRFGSPLAFFSARLARLDALAAFSAFSSSSNSSLSLAFSSGVGGGLSEGCHVFFLRPSTFSQIGSTSSAG